MTTVLCKANRELLFNDTRRKTCWLPCDEESPWQYCRHCSFTQKDKLFDSVLTLLRARADEMELPTGQKEKLLTVVQFPWFRHHCAHPASRLRLYHLMMLLRTHNPRLYHIFLQDQTLVPSFLRILQTHRPSNENLTSCKMMCDLVRYDIQQIPRHCVVCLYHLLKRNKDNREYYNAFTNYLRDYYQKPYQFAHPQTIMKEYVQLSIQKGDHNRQYAFSLLYEHYRRANRATGELRFHEFLQDFLLENQDTFGAIIHSDMSTLQDYRPEWLTEYEFQMFIVEPARLQWKQLMRARCDTYKEDLMIKTCHPRRLFKWIFDIEDLNDFEPYDEERDKWEE